jgi:hypothetical protein
MFQPSQIRDNLLQPNEEIEHTAYIQNRSESGIFSGDNDRDRRHSTIANLINESINTDSIFILVSAIRIVASTLALVTLEKTCNPKLETWILMLLIYDIFFLVNTIWLIIYIVSFFPNDNNSNEPIGGLQEIDGILSFPEFFRERNPIIRISLVLKLYFIISFIFGQVQYFKTPMDCSHGQVLIALSSAYICLGYLYLGLPILSLIINNICVPAVIFFDKLFSSAKKERSL